MNRNQKLLTSLIAASLKNDFSESYSQNNFMDMTSIDLPAIYEEAKAHEVHTIIYPLLSKLKFFRSGDIMLLSKWQKQIVMAGISQIRHMEEMKLLFKEFTNNGISFIPLKGLVLRELYPIPEMRTMGDADILVYENDLKRACGILSAMGYKKESIDSKHIHFIHKTKLCIELHFFLISQGSISKNLDSFENGVWKNAKKSYVLGMAANILSLEDQLLHLILHMAVHLSSGGFGLRQLCDLFLFIERNSENINWEYINIKTREYEIIPFTSTLFIICSKLFGMSLPNAYYLHRVEYNYVNALIEDIFSGGVFGDRTRERFLGGIKLHYITNPSTDKETNTIGSIIKSLFPPVHMLGLQYSYARNFPILTPIAWLHRIVYSIFRRDFTICEKRSFLMPDNKVNTELKNRAKLLHLLDLK